MMVELLSTREGRGEARRLGAEIEAKIKSFEAWKRILAIRNQGCDDFELDLVA